MDVDFSDNTDKVFNITKFDFVVRRDRGFDFARCGGCLRLHDRVRFAVEHDDRDPVARLELAHRCAHRVERQSHRLSRHRARAIDDQRQCQRVQLPLTNRRSC